MTRDALGIAAFAALIVAGIAGSIAGIGRSNEQRVLEATDQMEWLATKLEHANRVAPETKAEIAQLIRRPWYDCNQVACRMTLEKRNRDARARLQTILRNSTEKLNARAKQEPITIHARH